jgi:hypothetical protein
MAMDLYLKDLYGGGVVETSTSVQPDSSDQQALVDDQQTAEKVNMGGENKVRIFSVLAVIVIITFVASYLDK